MHSNFYDILFFSCSVGSYDGKVSHSQLNWLATSRSDRRGTLEMIKQEHKEHKHKEQDTWLRLRRNSPFLFFFFRFKCPFAVIPLISTVHVCNLVDLLTIANNCTHTHRLFINAIDMYMQISRYSIHAQGCTYDHNLMLDLYLYLHSKRFQ